VFIKPDGLVGPGSLVDRELVVDFLNCLALALSDLDGYAAYAPRRHSTPGAVALANVHILEEVGEEDWYNLEFAAVTEAQKRLQALARNYDCPGDPEAMTVVIEATICALGFTLSDRVDHVLTRDEFDALYRDSDAPLKTLGPQLVAYLVGHQIRILLLRGIQTNSALQIMKEYLRRIIRYPTGDYNALQNYLHVCDPDGRDVDVLIQICSGSKGAPKRAGTSSVTSRF
jgi:hypothetical protein